MGFSGIGIWEIVLIFVVIVIILGPHRLPEIARTMGKWFRTIKRAGSDISTSISRELEETKSQPPSQADKDTAAKPTAPADKNTAAKSTPPVKDKPASPGEGRQPKNE